MNNTLRDLEKKRDEALKDFEELRDTVLFIKKHCKHNWESAGCSDHCGQVEVCTECGEHRTV